MHIITKQYKGISETSYAAFGSVRHAAAEEKAATAKLRERPWFSDFFSSRIIP